MSYRGVSSRFSAGLIATLAALFALAFAPVSASAAETGSIAGKVTGAPGAVAVKNAEICAGKGGEEGESKCAESATDGSYEIAGLPAGQYKVEFSAAGTGRNLVRQFYQGAASSETATPVTVTVGATANNIDAELQPGGRISGTVTAAATKLPVAGVLACAFGSAGEECAETSAGGAYLIEGLPTGSFEVEFFDEEEFEPQFYPGKSSESEAVPVAVAVGATAEHIDAALFHFATVSGHVFVAADRRPAPSDEVCAFRSTVNLPYYCARADFTGGYSLELPPGAYKIAFSVDLSEFFPEFEPEPDGWPIQFWNVRSTFAQADVIALPREGAVTGIDGLLGYVPPAPAPAGPVVSPVVPKPRPKQQCKKGFHRVKRHGKSHCARVHKRHRHHGQNHRHHR